MSMPNLKTCPFCGGRAHLITESDRIGYDTYERTIDAVRITCVDCRSSGTEIIKKTLADFTSYTVQDFRQNPILRAKVEDEYEEYVKELNNQAIKAWNTRATK